MVRLMLALMLTCQMLYCCCCGIGLLLLWHWLAAAVVFGRVVEGMAVVKKIEALGSANGSGKTRGRITIADCGQVGQEQLVTQQ